MLLAFKIIASQENKFCPACFATSASPPQRSWWWWSWAGPAWKAYPREQPGVGRISGRDSGLDPGRTRGRDPSRGRAPAEPLVVNPTNGQLTRTARGVGVWGARRGGFLCLALGHSSRTTPGKANLRIHAHEN